MNKGMVLPLSTMPGEQVEHVYQGPMEAETIHFLDCVARGKQPLVTPEHARMVMQVYQAADQSAEENRPIDIAWPATDRRSAGETDFVGARTTAPARAQE